MRISEDRGGQIGHYLEAFAMVRSSGENVVIDGNCLSACTLVLGLIPRSRICATSRARLGFHAAWMPDSDGRPVTSAMGTQALWNIYPGSVRHWIKRHGGLSRHMIYLQGRELSRIVPRCGSESQAGALTPPIGAAPPALHTRKRRQRPPLAPSPRKRARRRPRPTRPTVPSRRP